MSSLNKTSILSKKITKTEKIMKTKNLKTYKAWGIPYGKGTQEVTIEVKANSKKEAKKKMISDGTKLTSEVYQ